MPSARRRCRDAFPASPPSRVQPRRCTRSRTRAPSRRCPCRSGSMSRRELRSVAGVEPVGAYTLLRVERGGLDPGVPGQFFMLEAPGRLLPRALSLCLAPRGELAFLLEAVGPGTEALCALEPGERIHVLGPLGNGFRLDVERPLLVGGAVAEIAPRAQLAWEAPMACGYGACYGCAVEIDGELKRLCVEGPVLEAA